MQLNELIQRRLASQRLTGTPCAGPAEVVAWLTAMQAQDYPASLWGVSQRCGMVTDTQVEEAMTAGAIIRSWSPRGTLHLLPAQDARWIIGLTAPGMIARMAKWHARDFDLTDRVLSYCYDVIGEALQGGKELQRSELYRVLNAAGVQTQGQRGLHILWRMGQERLICYGPRRSRPQTLVLFDEWLPDTPEKDRDEALAELTFRYFRSHGPASERDFAWWAGLNLSDVRRGLEMNAGRLAKADYNGHWHWFEPHEDELPGPEGVWLLPGYDEYSVAYKDRSLLRGPGLALSSEENSELIDPLIVVDGMARGRWKRNLRQGKLSLSFTPFEPLSEEEKARLEDIAEEYAGHLTRAGYAGEEGE